MLLTLLSGYQRFISLMSFYPIWEYLFYLLENRSGQKIVAVEIIMYMFIKQFLTGNVMGAVLFNCLDRVHQVNTFLHLVTSYAANNIVDLIVGTQPQDIQLTR